MSIYWAIIRQGITMRDLIRTYIEDIISTAGIVRGYWLMRSAQFLLPAVMWRIQSSSHGIIRSRREALRSMYGPSRWYVLGAEC